MKIVFSHWLLPGGGSGPICYHIGQYLAKNKLEVIFYIKKIDQFIKYGKIKQFENNFENSVSKEIIKDKPDFAYGLNDNARLKYIHFNGTHIQPAYHNTVSNRKNILANENPYLFDEKCSSSGLYSLNKEEQNKENNIIQSNDYIHVPCMSIKNDWVKTGFNKNRVILVPHGVDIKKFKPKPTKHKDFNILFVGNGAIRKGLQYLIKAWEIIYKKQRNIKLIIISKNVSNIKIPGIELLKKISSEDMPNVYNKSDLLILPSLSDAMPLVGLEAMACGLPIIMTKNIGYGEIIKNGKNGFLVNKKDIKEIVKFVNLLINNPKLRNKMGKQARKTAINNTWDIQGIKFKKLLNDIYANIS